MGGRRDAAGVETDVLAVSARVPLPQGFAAHGSYRTTEVGTTKTAVSTVGVSKALSKRTTLGADAFRAEIAGGSTGYVLRARHNF